MIISYARFIIRIIVFVHDEDIGGGMTKATNLEDIQGLGGPMTRAKAKKAKEALNLLVTLMQAQVRRKKRPK